MKRFIYIPTFLFQFLFLNDARNFLFTLKKKHTGDIFGSFLLVLRKRENEEKSTLLENVFEERFM